MKAQQVSLGYRPREWQRQVHLGLKRFSVVVVHRRGGKSEVAIMELVHRALNTDKDLWLGAYVAPFQKQARAIAWARLKDKVRPLEVYGIVEISEVEMTVRFTHNGASIRLFGADMPHALRGLRLDFAVIDEVAQVKPEVWTEVIQPALSDRKGGALFIGTPYGVNLFSELYFKATSDPDWYAARFTVYDTHAIDDDEVARMKADMPDQVFARELLCDFSAAGDDQLISLSDVEAAASRHVDKMEYMHAARVIGVDPARFGDDRSVIFKRQGLVAHEPVVLRGVDNMALAGRVAQEIQDYQPDAVFVDSGNGSGVIDRLRQLGFTVIEVFFGGKPNDVRYLNKRAEMWFEMADWLRQGGAIPNRVDLKQDLAAPIYWYDSAGKRQLEPKDDLKKRGLPSPDLGDALALTFAQPVKPKSELQRAALPGAHRVKRQSYDPYANLNRR